MEFKSWSGAKMNYRLSYIAAAAIVAVLPGLISQTSRAGRTATAQQTNLQAVAALRGSFGPPASEAMAANGPQASGLPAAYETDYLKMSIPAGWAAKEAAPHSQPDPAAVNIMKGKYILYIDVHTGQASGTPGGRFAEIAMGAPSADAVVPVQPSPPCGHSETHVAGPYKRVDLFVSGQDKSEFCGAPSNGRTVWYFSYVTDSTGGYFNYYKLDEPPGLVATMAYNSKDLNSLPVKGSPGLARALAEMTGMIKSLEIKPLAKQQEN
jgi:hypothetical protein